MAKFTIDAKIDCVKSNNSDGHKCICCEDGNHVAFRKLRLVDSGLPEYMQNNLENWLDSQVNFKRFDGKTVKVTFEIED